MPGMLGSVLSIAAGASLGALLRWVLAVRFNPLYPTLPLGTLGANLLGGYLVGVAIAYFAVRADLPPEVRLFVITGFLGGLTTFSTYSAVWCRRMSRSSSGVAGTLVNLSARPLTTSSSRMRSLVSRVSSAGCG